MGKGSDFYDAAAMARGSIGSLDSLATALSDAGLGGLSDKIDVAVDQLSAAVEAMIAAHDERLQELFRQSEEATFQVVGAALAGITLGSKQSQQGGAK